MRTVRVGPSVPVFEALPMTDAYFQSRARREGEQFDESALEYLGTTGAQVLRRGHKIRSYSVDGLISGPNGRRVLVAAHGTFDDHAQSGLRRTDTLHKLAHRALMLHRDDALPLLVVTSHLPKRGSTGARQLADLHRACGYWLVDVIATTGDLGGFQRVHKYLNDAGYPSPESAPWWTAEGQLELDFLVGSDA